jgi:hypothetical protein
MPILHVCICWSCYVNCSILYIPTTPHQESLHVFTKSAVVYWCCFKEFATLNTFMYLTFLWLEVGPASGLKQLVVVEVHIHLSKTLCCPYKSQFNISVHRNKDVSFIQSFIHSSVLRMGSQSVSRPLAICTTDTRLCPFQDPKRRTFQVRGHAHIRPAAVFVQKLSLVTVLNTCSLILT